MSQVTSQVSGFVWSLSKMAGNPGSILAKPVGAQLYHPSVTFLAKSVGASQCPVSRNQFINQLSNPQCCFLFSSFVLRRKGVIIFVLTFGSIALAAI